MWADHMMREQLGEGLYTDLFKLAEQVYEERSYPQDYDKVHCHVYGEFEDRKAIIFSLKYPQAKMLKTPIVKFAK